jgi:large subunit ribosomal protein L23
MKQKPINLLPRLSEKTYSLSSQGVYVVDVNNKVNSLTIKETIEEQFKVKVKSVRVVNVKGKARRTISDKGRRVIKGTDQDYKKAYISLMKGESLPFFNAIEEEENQAEKVQEEMAKQLEKQDKKNKGRLALRPKKLARNKEKE